MQRSYEPTQRTAMIQRLKTIPRLTCRRHVNQRKQNAGDKLEHEACECRAPENIEPGGGVARNRVIGHFKNPLLNLEQQNEPPAEFLDQTPVCLPQSLFATG